MNKKLKNFIETHPRIYRAVALYGALCVLDDLDQNTDINESKKEIKQLLKSEIV